MITIFATLIATLIVFSIIQLYALKQLIESNKDLLMKLTSMHIDVMKLLKDRQL